MILTVPRTVPGTQSVLNEDGGHGMAVGEGYSHYVI